MLYTDGQIQATRTDALAFLADLDAVDNLVARETARQEVQDHIDGTPVLAAAEIAAELDSLDASYVVLAFPQDVGKPYFWAGVTRQIIDSYGGIAVEGDPYRVRVRKDRAIAHLTYLAALL